jgi:hypothetical protein
MRYRFVFAWHFRNRVNGNLLEPVLVDEPEEVIDWYKERFPDMGNMLIVPEAAGNGMRLVDEVNSTLGSYIMEK